MAIAEDTDGVAVNPAADAVRLPYSSGAWDYGFGLSVAIGAWLPKNDFYNRSNGSKAGQGAALFGSLAAVVNFEHAGFGLAGEAQRNAATRVDQPQGIAPTSLAANFGTAHASLAYGFFDGQLLLGAGPRLIGISFGGGSSAGLLSAAGLGYEAGAIIKPYTCQWRIGAAAKSPILASVLDEPGAAATHVHLPWEVAVGFAYQFGARPFNPQLLTARHLAQAIAVDREPNAAEVERAEAELFRRYQSRPRWYLLVSSELSVVQGGGHVGLENGDVVTSQPSFSPRLGLESEVIAHILKARAGSYYEQARATGAPSRIHATGGFDLRLFEWDVFGLHRPFDYWQLSVGADAASSYLNTSFSIGFWH